MENGSSVLVEMDELRSERKTANFVDGFPKSVALGYFVYIYFIYHSSAVASLHA